MTLLKNQKLTIPFRSIEAGRVSHAFIWCPDILDAGVGRSFPNEIQVETKVVKVENSFLVEIHAESDAVLSCDRCGIEFTKRTEGCVKSFYTYASECIENDWDGGDAQLIPAAAQELDITQDALDALVLGIPGKCLCKDDCLGLCIQCGMDLNQKQCSCSTDTNDPRWDALKNISFDC